jgi:hypothetical protein
MTMSFVFSAFSLLIIGVLGDYLGLKNTYFVTASLGLLAIPFIVRLPKEEKTPIE